MNQPKTLDLSGGWENIVNNHSKRMNAEKQNQFRKWMVMIVAALCCLLITLVFWLLNICSGIPAIMITELCSCIAAFVAGRIWEGYSR